MKALVKVCTFLFLFLLLASCRKPDTVFVCDPIWYEIVSSRIPVESSLRKAARHLKLSPLPLIYLNDENEVEFKLYPEGQALYSRMVFTPLAYYWWSALHGNEDKDIAVAGGFQNKESNSVSTHFITTDRLDAFTAAGTAAGEYISSREEESVMVLHVLNGNREREEETQAFIEAYNEVAGDQSLYLHRVNDLKDNRLDMFESQLQDKNVVCRGYFVPGLNEYLLNYHKDPEIRIYTENFQGCNLVIPQEIYTIEKDYNRIILESLRSISLNTEPMIKKVPAVLVKYRSPKK